MRSISRHKVQRFTTEGGRSMRSRCARLTGIAACVAALAAPSASAESFTYTAPGTTEVSLPLGVTIVHVVAVGGRGGGLTGGFGAAVTADVRVAARLSTAPTQLRI